MKRAIDEEKITGPMFPRLHVNDTEKGGPRAPPRNKMALYEQLSIPSKRSTPGALNPPNISNSKCPASFSKETGSDRDMHLSLDQQTAAPMPLDEMLHSHESGAQIEQGSRTGNEDEFMVPIFFQPEKNQCHNKHQQSVDINRLVLSAPAYSDHPAKRRNSSDQDLKYACSTDTNLGQGYKIQGEFIQKEVASSRDQQKKPTTMLPDMEKTVEHVKAICIPSDEICQYQPVSPQKNVSILQEAPKSIIGTKDADNGTASLQVIASCSGELHIIPNSLDNSVQMGNMDRSDDGSATSMVDPVSVLDISPDEVVAIIGQRHFWKARRTIVNQQRVFAVQIFELHRLIKVQRLIAGLPQQLCEDRAYLGKPSLKSSPVMKFSSKFSLKHTPLIAKHKDKFEKANYKIEGSAQNAVGKASLCPVKNGSQPSNYGNPPQPSFVSDVGNPWSFHQLPGHQWLVPVMSPSEGLIYKPYPGPALMGKGFGRCGPMGTPHLAENFVNQTYSIFALHHPEHQEIGGLPAAPPPQGHFPPYRMPVMNPFFSGSTIEQMDMFHNSGSHGQPNQSPEEGGSQNAQQRSSSLHPVQKTGAPSQMKLPSSKDSELQAGRTSGHSGRMEGVEGGKVAEGGDSLSSFPIFPLSLEGASQPHCVDQPTRAIRVVPHNARSASASAARIFQSIQQGRKKVGP